MKFSIIIPIYNSEKYLDICLNSIVNQTYKNIEIILVNDGSTDKSLRICKEFESKDSRILIINKSNSGPSDSRNKGIEVANGDYIVFVDSDDYVEKDFIEMIASNLEGNDTDIIFYGFIKENEDFKEINKNIPKSKKYQKHEFSEAIPFLVDNDILGYQWSKIIKASIIKKNNIFLDTHLSLNEDLLFTFKIFDYIDNILVLSIAPYHYIERIGSLTKIYRENIISEQESVFNQVYQFYSRFHIVDFNRLIVERTSLSLMICSNNIISGSIGEQIKHCKAIRNSFIFKQLKNNKKEIKKYISGRRRIPLILSAYLNMPELLLFFMTDCNIKCDT